MPSTAFASRSVWNLGQANCGIIRRDAAPGQIRCREVGDEQRVMHRVAFAHLPACESTRYAICVNVKNEMPIGSTTSTKAGREPVIASSRVEQEVGVLRR